MNQTFNISVEGQVTVSQKSSGSLKIKKEAAMNPFAANSNLGNMGISRLLINKLSGLPEKQLRFSEDSFNEEVWDEIISRFSRLSNPQINYSENLINEEEWGNIKFYNEDNNYVAGDLRGTRHNYPFIVAAAPIFLSFNLQAQQPNTPEVTNIILCKSGQETLRHSYFTLDEVSNLDNVTVFTKTTVKTESLIQKEFDIKFSKYLEKRKILKTDVISIGLNNVFNYFVDSFVKSGVDFKECSLEISIDDILSLNFEINKTYFIMTSLSFSNIKEKDNLDNVSVVYTLFENDVRVVSDAKNIRQIVDGVKELLIVH